MKTSTARAVCLGVFGWLMAAAASAQSLNHLYQAARDFDATYLSAQANHRANVAKAEQAQAAVRPSVDLTANASWSDTKTDVSASRSSQNQTVGITAVQPLYRPANLATARQGEQTLVLAQAQLQAAEQDLMVRTAQAYFDVLSAQDSLTLMQAQKTAITEQLAAARRNFEVGTATITDTREAQAQFDLVVAKEIAADNDLRVKKLALDQLVGRTDTQPLPLRTPVDLPAVIPASHLPTWVEQAQAQHPSVRQAQAALAVAQLEAQKAQAGHGPTLDLSASYQTTRAPSAALSSNLRSHNSNVALIFKLPIYAGGAIQNRVTETLALQDKAATDVTAAQRAVAQATRSSYYGVVSGLSQVKALEAAQASSQSALDANRLGYEVGVRINIDVLNAQSQLFQTQRDLAAARYNVLLGTLRFKQASGALSEPDIAAISALTATR